MRSPALRATIALAAAAALGSGCAAAVERRAATARASIEEARLSEAYRCAPEELALAEFHLDVATVALDDGDGAAAMSHVDQAETSARAAIARAAPCRPAVLVRPGDRDGDGTGDTDDACPDWPGEVARLGCPDTDGDLVFDDIDRCRLEAEDRDGFRDEDGCPDLDDDEDGIADAHDACKREPGPLETRGCPDADGDFVADAEDRCPKEAGVRDSENGAGCPSAKPAAVAAAPAAPGGIAIDGDQLKLPEAIAFEPFADTILSPSHAMLKELAAMLRENPKLKLRIEGHTDPKGHPKVITWLARVRARAVRSFLVKEGVPAARLQAVGLGATQPIAKSDTAEGRAANERIELVVTSR